MSKVIGVFFLVVIFSADVASSQSLSYVNKSNPGSTQLSNHQRFVGTQLRRRNRQFGYQRNAANRQRMSQLKMRAIRRSAGQAGNRTGTSAEVVARKRQQIRSRQLHKRTSVGTRTSQLQVATRERSRARRKAQQHPPKRRISALGW
jgi:hypothetical protein